MSEKCDVCQRPYCRTLLGDSRDFEQRAKCWKIGYERLQGQFAAGAEVAAAEERGRRSGAEERDELRTLLGNLLPLASRASKTMFLSDSEMKAFVEAQVALAPRDSAPSCGADEDGIHREARKERK